MYWDPFEELNRMHEEMDRMFEKAFFGEQRLLLEDKQAKNLPAKRTPICHMQETESQYIASFELPGVDKKDIHLVVDDDHIELKVESKQEKKEKNSYISQSKSYQRYVHMPKPVDSAKANAEYKNGILRVEIPKKSEKSKGKILDIN